MDSLILQSGETCTLPDSAFTAPDGTFFIEWNTLKDGSGISYSENESFIAGNEGETIVLYAQWGTPFNMTFNTNLAHPYTGNQTSQEVALGYKARTGETYTAYSHSANIRDDGTMEGYYGSNLNTIEVVRIPGATSLSVTLTYQTQSITFDWVCIWEGAHPEYRPSNQYSLAIDGKLGGSTTTTKNYTITGDSVSLGFRTNGSNNNYYGYYAVVTANIVTESNHFYDDFSEPTDFIYGDGFLGYSADADNPDSPIITDYQQAYLNGTRSVTARWDTPPTSGNQYAILDDAGNLTFFRSFEDREAGTGSIPDIFGTVRTGIIYPGVLDTDWKGDSRIRTVDVADNQTIIRASFKDTFSGCANLRSADLYGIDTSGISDMSGLFEDCSALETLDISSFDTSSATDMGSMFSGCSSLYSITLGPDYSFTGNGITDTSKQAILPDIAISFDDYFTGEWIGNANGATGVSPTQLRGGYDGSQESGSYAPGTYTWDVGYKISFSAGDGTGQMPDVMVDCREGYDIPEPAFTNGELQILGWRDSDGRRYSAQATIPANSYAEREDVILTAVWYDPNGEQAAPEADYDEPGNIIFTVPSRIVYSQRKDGSLMGPTNAYMENNSDLPIYVSSLAVVPEGGWRLVSDISEGGDGKRIELLMGPDDDNMENLVRFTENGQGIARAKDSIWNSSAWSMTATSDDEGMDAGDRLPLKFDGALDFSEDIHDRQKVCKIQWYVTPSG